MGHNPVTDYGIESENTANQLIFAQKRLISNMLSLWIKKSLTTYAKLKLRASKISYTYNNQDDGYAIFFVIIKMVCLGTLTRLSDTKKNL